MDACTKVQHRFKQGGVAHRLVADVGTFAAPFAVFVFYQIRAFLNDRNHAVGVLVVRVLQLFANKRLAKGIKLMQFLHLQSFGFQNRICKNQNNSNNFRSMRRR